MPNPSSGSLRWLALALVAIAAPGCYRIHVDESYWLRSRPGPTADTREVAARLAPLAARVHAVRVPVGGGEVISGIVVVHPDAEATVIFFGGDDFRLARKGAETISRIVAAARVHVVVADYAGQGESSGAPSMSRLKSDALALHEWTTDQAELGDVPLIVHGNSMGSFVAASVANERPVDGLVLQSSATTIPDWARSFFRPSRFKWWARPAYPFIRLTIDPALETEDNLVRVRDYTGPLLIIVGADDHVTPPAMSRALYEGSATPEAHRALVVLDGAGHDDVLSNPGFPPAYADFLDTVGLAKAASD